MPKRQTTGLERVAPRPGSRQPYRLRDHGIEQARSPWARTAAKLQREREQGLRPSCSVDDCYDAIHARTGLCHRHWMRQPLRARLGEAASEEGGVGGER